MLNRILTRDQVRQVDRIAIEKFGMSSLVLMENAARGASDVLCNESKKPASVLILCGLGNNGGDGLAIARHLHLREWRVSVLMLGSANQISDDAKANLQILQKTKVPIEYIQVDPSTHKTADADPTKAEPAGIWESKMVEFDWIIDALVGTGSTPPLRWPMNQIVKSANRQSARRFAIDIPSGIDCDIGEISGAVFRADLTATFVAVKRGMLTEFGRECCGQIHVVDIGVPPEVIELAVG